jgi:hypothetical protein
MGRSEKNKKKIEKNQAGMCPAAPRLRQKKGRKGLLVWTGEDSLCSRDGACREKIEKERYRGSTTIHAESYSKERKTRGIRKVEEMKLRGKNGRGSGTWN